MTIKYLYKMNGLAQYIISPRPQSGYTIQMRRLIADEGYILKHKTTGEEHSAIDILKDEVDDWEEIPETIEQEETALL